MTTPAKTARHKAAGTYLRTLREARDLTCRQLAVQLGFEETSSHIISMIESGRVALPREKWYPAAKALGADELVFAELMLKWYMPDLHAVLFDQFGLPRAGSRTAA